MKNLILFVIILLTANSYASSGINPELIYAYQNVNGFNQWQGGGMMGQHPGFYDPRSIGPNPYFTHNPNNGMFGDFGQHRTPFYPPSDQGTINLDDWRRINPPSYQGEEPRFFPLPYFPDKEPRFSTLPYNPGSIYDGPRYQIMPYHPPGPQRSPAVEHYKHLTTVR